MSDRLKDDKTSWEVCNNLYRLIYQYEFSEEYLDALFAEVEEVLDLIRLKLGRIRRAKLKAEDE
jgi:hypothetical protein